MAQKKTIKASFVLYHEDYEATREFTLEQKGQIWNAIFEYSIHGKIPKLAPSLTVAFRFMRNKLDRDLVKYQQTCARNAENGRKGPVAKIQKPVSDWPGAAGHSSRAVTTPCHRPVAVAADKEI